MIGQSHSDTHQTLERIIPRRFSHWISETSTPRAASSTPPAKPGIPYECVSTCVAKPPAKPPVPSFAPLVSRHPLRRGKTPTTGSDEGTHPKDLPCNPKITQPTHHRLQSAHFIVAGYQPIVAMDCPCDCGATTTCLHCVVICPVTAATQQVIELTDHPGSSL